MSHEKRYFDQWNGTNTLFAIYLGANDISVLNTNKTVNNQQYVNNNKAINENLRYIINIMFKKIENMYEVGGRNFMILNVFPIDLAPVNDNGKYNYLKEEVLYFNSLLSEKSKTLFNKYSDINVIVYNTHEEYKYILGNSTKFNFKFINKLCKFNKKSKRRNCNKYFWYDPTHITKKGNTILAEDINELLKSINK
ncbi:hypothetical protein BCR36DRAFT_374638 [Piromyces finnis]|uniref:SGNH hydrolase-type esterase domain-containing protein n=1 Tax=Piromyces finnis TaxID=1754191 RepID=A0A1Y1UW06_9FUNG|nr:hypothetical protein BCR36DRAFT_374638 [Piromyces finnis]|eukprot:ORX42263.1 hypothetical protein BCR36DRAFT_374638 [Piromyces finnis]